MTDKPRGARVNKKTRTSGLAPQAEHPAETRAACSQVGQNAPKHKACPEVQTIGGAADPSASGRITLRVSRAFHVRRALCIRDHDLIELERIIVELIRLDAGPGSQVALSYSLARDDGAEFTAASAADMISYEFGDRSRLTGLRIWGRDPEGMWGPSGRSISVTAGGDEPFPLTSAYVRVEGPSSEWVHWALQRVRKHLSPLCLWYGTLWCWVLFWFLLLAPAGVAWSLPKHTFVPLRPLGLLLLAGGVCWELAAARFGVSVCAHLYPMSLIALGDQKARCELTLNRQRRIARWLPGVFVTIVLAVVIGVWIVPYVQRILGK